MTTDQRTSLAWILLAAVLGFIFWFLPFRFASESAAIWLMLGGLSVSSFVVGYFRHTELGRLCVAFVAAPTLWYALSGVLLEGKDYEYPAIYRLIGSVFIALAFAVALCIPVFLGMWLGSTVKKFRTRDTSSPDASKNFIWGIFALGMGVLAVFVPLATLPPQSAAPFYLVPLLLAVVSGILGFINPRRGGLTMIMITVAAPLAVLIRALIDLSADPTSHNLLPLELFSAAFVGIVAASIGTLIGTSLKKGIRNQ